MNVSPTTMCFERTDTLSAEKPSKALGTPPRYDGKNGKVMITDGPYAETKEYLGGILLLKAKDLDHAIQLMSKHPGVKAGPFEIRPAADLSNMIRESERRRSKAQR